jgi:hypothetical protein
MAVVAAVAAAAMVVAGLVVAGLEVAPMLGLEGAAAASGLEGARAAPGLEVVDAAGSSLDVEVAARSEVAAGSEVAGAAAAGSLASGSVTTFTMTTMGTVTSGMGGPAAHPGERAACAKSQQLTAAVMPTFASLLEDERRLVPLTNWLTYGSQSSPVGLRRRAQQL